VIGGCGDGLKHDMFDPRRCEAHRSCCQRQKPKGIPDAGAEALSHDRPKRHDKSDPRRKRHVRA
jgi:hypothetical protein